MISFGNVTSSHSGLIPIKTVYKKRGELLWAIASKKNFTNLHSAAFITDFVSQLEHQIFREIPTVGCQNFFINFVSFEMSKRKKKKWIQCSYLSCSRLENIKHAQSNQIDIEYSNCSEITQSNCTIHGTKLAQSLQPVMDVGNIQKTFVVY